MIDSFRAECVQIGTKAKNKKELLREISFLAKNHPSLSQISAGELEKELSDREEIISTGLTNGIAIPHCAFEGIKDFVVGLLIVKDGIDFESLDGEKCKLFFFIIGPKSERNKHIKVLSSISKLSKDKKMIKELVHGDSKESVAQMLILPDEQLELKKTIEKAQFTIHVQNEDIFLDVLEILSSEVEGSVSVIDGDTAGHYLHRLPLFSTFWNENNNDFCKIIMAVIDKRLMNDTIRRINMILPEKENGIMISVSDVIYFDGSINF